ncbi:MAG: hypothetical protein JO270_06245 [Acidobacteriaceae bacterium]|nr:hypothetical protein [Acidobacteriaceae bacterium]
MNMEGPQLVSAPDFNDFLQLADHLRQLSNQVAAFANEHLADLSPEQLARLDASSRELTDAFHILLGSDVDARIQAAKAGVERLKKITGDAEVVVRRVKKIDKGVKIAVALGGMAVAILEKDPGAIKDSAGQLASALEDAV